MTHTIERSHPLNRPWEQVEELQRVAFPQDCQYKIETPAGVFTSTVSRHDDRIVHVSESASNKALSPVIRAVFLGVRMTPYTSEQATAVLLQQPYIQALTPARKLLIVHDMGNNPAYVAALLQEYAEAEQAQLHTVGLSIGCADALSVLQHRGDIPARLDAISPVTGAVSAEFQADVQERVEASFKQGENSSTSQRAMDARIFERVQRVRGTKERFQGSLEGVSVKLHATMEDQIYNPVRAQEDVIGMGASASQVRMVFYAPAPLTSEDRFVHAINPVQIVDGEPGDNLFAYLLR